MPSIIPDYRHCQHYYREFKKSNEILIIVDDSTKVYLQKF